MVAKSKIFTENSNSSPDTIKVTKISLDSAIYKTELNVTLNIESKEERGTMLEKFSTSLQMQNMYKVKHNLEHNRIIITYNCYGTPSPFVYSQLNKLGGVIGYSLYQPHYSLVDSLIKDNMKDEKDKSYLAKLLHFKCRPYRRNIIDSCPFGMGC